MGRFATRGSVGDAIVLCETKNSIRVCARKGDENGGMATAHADPRRHAERARHDDSSPRKCARTGRFSPERTLAPTCAPGPRTPPCTGLAERPPRAEWSLIVSAANVSHLWRALVQALDDERTCEAMARLACPAMSDLAQTAFPRLVLNDHRGTFASALGALHDLAHVPDFSLLAQYDVRALLVDACATGVVGHAVDRERLRRVLVEQGGEGSVPAAHSDVAEVATVARARCVLAAALTALQVRRARCFGMPRSEPPSLSAADAATLCEALCTDVLHRDVATAELRGIRARVHRMLHGVSPLSMCIPRRAAHTAKEERPHTEREQASARGASGADTTPRADVPTPSGADAQASPSAAVQAASGTSASPQHAQAAGRAAVPNVREEAGARAVALARDTIACDAFAFAGEIQARVRRILEAPCHSPDWIAQRLLADPMVRALVDLVGAMPESRARHRDLALALWGTARDPRWVATEEAIVAAISARASH